MKKLIIGIVFSLISIISFSKPDVHHYTYYNKENKYNITSFTDNNNHYIEETSVLKTKLLENRENANYTLLLEPTYIKEPIFYNQVIITNDTDELKAEAVGWNSKLNANEYGMVSNILIYSELDLYVLEKLAKSEKLNIYFVDTVNNEKYKEIVTKSEKEVLYNTLNAFRKIIEKRKSK